MPQFLKFTPKITIFLPVKNESIVIISKLEEIMNYDYPKENINILIIDSNSTDNTVRLANDFLKKNSYGIPWEIIETNLLGKSNAVNIALEMIKTDFFVMLDAEAIIQRDSISRLMSHFNDTNIGGICGFLKTFKNNPDHSYRTKFNILRFGESKINSTPIFEGSLCAFRLQSIAYSRINPNINSDDSQLALIVKRNGYRAIMDNRIFFTEPPVFGRERSKRQLRRSQGLIRTLMGNKDMIFNSDFKIIFFHTFFFHLLLPWLFIISMVSFLFAGLSSYLYGNYSINIYLLEILLILFCISAIKNFLFGVLILIKAQVYLLLGIRLNIWDTDQIMREESYKLR